MITNKTTQIGDHKLAAGLSFAGLMAQFIFAVTLLAPYTFIPSPGKTMVVAVVFLLPWLPQVFCSDFRQRLCSFRWHPVDYCLLAFVAISLLSCLGSFEPRVSWGFFLKVCLTLASPYALCRVCLESAEQVKKLGLIWVICLGVLSALGIAEKLTDTFIFARFWGFHHQAFDPELSVWRMFLLWLNPIPAAQTFLLLAAGLGAVCWLKNKTGIFLWLFLALLGMTAIWFTQTRGALLAGVLALVAICATFRKRMVLIMLLTLGIVSSVSYPYWPIRLRSVVGNRVLDNTLSLRLEYYPFALEIIKTAPWLGIGPRVGAGGSVPGGGYAAFAKNYQVKFLAGAEARRFFDELHEKKTLDNTFLTILVEHGLPAAIAFIAFICLVFIQAWRKYGGCEPPGNLAHTLIFFGGAYALTMLESDTLVWYHLNVMLGVLAGTLGSRGLEELFYDQRSLPRKSP